jgi:hypothetical protein
VVTSTKGLRTSRERLQRELGDDQGYVLPRQPHGTLERPAQGWYAKLTSGEVTFLGDYELLALYAIQKLRKPQRRRRSA